MSVTMDGNQKIVTNNTSMDGLYITAWESAKKLKNMFWIGVVSIGLIYIIANAFVPVLSGLLTAKIDLFSTTVHYLLHLGVLLFLITPLVAGLMMLSVKQAAPNSRSLKIIFSYLQYWKELCVYSVGLILFHYLHRIVPNYFLTEGILWIAHLTWMIGFLFFLPLIIEKQLSVSDTLKLNWQIIKTHKKEFINFVGLGGIILFASLFTLGIAFIWTLPWVWCAIGLFYHRVCA